MPKIIHIVGTRPNFVKIAPLMEAFSKHKGISQLLVHTGQHFDEAMSKLFFDDLRIPRPNFTLDIHAGTHLEQLTAMMAGLEKIFSEERPNLVVVVGDVNSTLAGALTAKKMGIALCHVEAGLRSFDRSMPEEINRIIIDHLSDFLFTTEESANRNLANEGIPQGKIRFVGNVMIDTLLHHRKEAEKSGILERMDLTEKGYAVLTLHRPSNVDEKPSFAHLFSILKDIASKTQIVFPVHPRTKKSLERFGMQKEISKSNILLCDPLGYLDFLCLMANASLVLTDSGGIQEETTALGVPCITLRGNTERPATLESGTNLLVSTERKKILGIALPLLDKKKKIRPNMPPLWDGKAADRIANILLGELKGDKLKSLYRDSTK